MSGNLTYRLHDFNTNYIIMIMSSEICKCLSLFRVPSFAEIRNRDGKTIFVINICFIHIINTRPREFIVPRGAKIKKPTLN